MNTQFTTIQTPFLKLNLTPINTFAINVDSMKYPSGLEFGKKYYKVCNKKLIAFKVIAITFKLYRSYYTCAYYTQYNSGEPVWEFGHELFNVPIFTSKEHYLNYVNGYNNAVQPVDLGFQSICKILNFSSKELSFKKTYIMSKYTQKPELKESYIKHVLFTNEGMFVCLSHQFSRYGNQYNGYDNYNDCMANYLNGMVVEDFEDEIYNINIEVNVFKPSTSVIKIVEMR